jgi:adenosylhomocysteine nucleosidase
MAHVVVACGLLAEARIAAGPGVRCVVAAGEALRTALERAVADGASALASFGLAGGLAPMLRPGDWLIGRAVVTAGGRWASAPMWTDALAARLPQAHRIALAGSDRIIADPRDKRALYAQLGAAAVDMESHIVAQVASEHALPFAVLRVVADPAERPLPSAACLDLAPGGRVAWLALLKSLLAEPGQIPALARVAIDARSALRALSSGRRQLGTGLGSADLGQLVLDVP